MSPVWPDSDLSGLDGRRPPKRPPRQWDPARLFDARDRTTANVRERQDRFATRTP